MSHASGSHLRAKPNAVKPHENCYCEECYPLVDRKAYKEIFNAYQMIAEREGGLRDQIKNLEKEEAFLVKSCESKDRYIDHLLERIEQLEASIISGGAIVPDAKPFEE